MLQALNNIPGAPVPVGAYSQVVRAGNLLFCAGQVGLVPETGKLAGESFEAQAKQVLANIDAVLRGAGSSPAEIVMTTVFLTAMSYAPVMNGLYSEFVNQAAPPARQTVAVKELPLGALVEISVIAVSR